MGGWLSSHRAACISGPFTPPPHASMKTKFAPVAIVLAALALTVVTTAMSRGMSSARAVSNDASARHDVAAPPAPPAPPTPPCGPALAVPNAAKDSRCFELRTYTVKEGSSIDLLHSRFREHTVALFRKHGMDIVGFWQPVARPDQLIYILAYKDAATRDSAWAAFGADAEWVKTRSEMPVNVQVDNGFMVATDYSPLK